MTAPGTTITIAVEDAPVQGAFARLVELGGDLTPVMRQVGAQLRKHVDERFERGAGPGNVPWRQSRRAREEGGQTLVERGRLRDSITFQADAASVAIGTNVRYAAIHQFGGDIRQGAYSRQVAFRRVKRQRADGTEYSASIFARMLGNRAHKRVETRQVSFAERVISMPARPFLGFDAEDGGAVLALIEDAIEAAAGGRAAAP